MEEKYPVLAEVEYHEYGNVNPKNEVVIFYANTYTDAMKTIEEYYGDELGSVKITLFPDGLLRFNPEDMTTLMKAYNELY